jgi:unsaturated rhamnogalacturonyl hydrolase
VVRFQDICHVGGLGPGNKRDGSVAYYLSEPISADDAKGVGPFMMAYSEYLRTADLV